MQASHRAAWRTGAHVSTRSRGSAESRAKAVPRHAHRAPFMMCVVSVVVPEREQLDVVRLRDAAKRYRWNGPWVLEGVDVALEAGALVEVRGPNGAGKSTLLRLLAG